MLIRKLITITINIFKMVLKNIIPQENAPYTPSRPKEPIDAFASQTSLDHRMVMSTVTIGSLNHLMIELDRSIKDMMGIAYDESVL